MNTSFYKDQLLKLRSRLAYETKNKHSWSFTDNELNALLKAQPRTIQELGKIKGFPLKGKRVASYGEIIINIFKMKPFCDFKVKMSPDGENLKVDGVMKPLSHFGK